MTPSFLWSIMDKQARKIMSVFNDRTINEHNARQIAFWCVHNAGEAMPVLMAFSYYIDLESKRARDVVYDRKEW